VKDRKEFESLYSFRRDGHQLQRGKGSDLPEEKETEIGCDAYL
jgi:hypothetical protein